MKRFFTSILFCTFPFVIASNAQPIPFTKKTLLDSVALHPHVADINHDGLNDLVVVSDYVDEKETDANVKHLCWLEAPGYKQHTISKLVYRSCHLAIADLDWDGYEDVVGSDDKDGQDANGNEGLFWMKNPGKSGAWAYNRIGMTPYTKDILVADFDGDGWKDVVSRSLDPLPNGSHGSHLDIFFSDKGKGFTKQRVETPAFDGTCLADIDRDGDMDIVINGAWMENPKQRNAAWKQYDYDKTWYTMSENGKTEWNHNNCRLAVADFDHDGIQDIVIASGESKGYPLVWLKGPLNPKTETLWKKNVIDAQSEYTHTVRVGDMDNDGDVDVITGSLIFWNEQKEPTKNPHPTVVYKNNGQGSAWEKQVLDNEGMYSGMVGDLGNDGDLDIVSPKNYNMKPLSIWENKTSDNKLAASQWSYVQVDNSRAKWGDFKAPDWLRYFGNDARDVTGDGFAEIVAGRYVYASDPKSGLTQWKRTDLGENIDGMLWADVDGDLNADIIAEALPGIYWLEATDKTLSKWTKTKIAEIKETDHVNGQGYKLAQVVPGGKSEILLNGGDGLYMLEIPANAAQGNWPKTLISNAETNDEGISVGDVDGDGDVDIISSRNNGIGPKTFVWYANPGADKERTDKWTESLIGSVHFWADRVETADFNGDGLLDVVVSEERYPGLQPDASLFWFEQKRDFGCILWIRHLLKTTYSMNSLDVADVDKDGDADILTNEHKGSEHPTYLYVNDGRGNFTETTIDTGHEHHLGTQFFDMDSDGDLDIIGPAWDEWAPFHLLRNDAIQNVKTTFAPKIAISETSDEGQAAYKIQTPTATYYYQKEGGGFSSILDNYGNDWIGYRNSGNTGFPHSAAADYRGIPNAVNNEPGSGVSHPGFDKCTSRMVDGNTIETESKDGKWKWRWQFYDDHAKLTMLKTDESRAYWFLYEGTIGGKYNPDENLWGTDKDGLRQDKPDFIKTEGVTGHWQWVFFGDKSGKNTFYAAQAQPDASPDIFGFMGNTRDGLPSPDGMVVFGFGRDHGTTSLLRKPLTFYIGFLNENIQAPNTRKNLKKLIGQVLKPK